MSDIMSIEYHSKLRVEFYVNPNKKRRWKLIEPFEFSVDGKRFVVPVDFWTDFASIPRLIWPIVSPYEIGVGPIPHDMGYFCGFETKEYWDLVLQACMIKDKIAHWKEYSVYHAVDMFGGWTWDDYRRTNTKFTLMKSIKTEKFEFVNWWQRPFIRVIGDAMMTEAQLGWKLQIEQLTSPQG